MTAPVNLIREARALAKLKKHDLGEFISAEIDTGDPPLVSKSAMVAMCKKCMAYAGIDSQVPSGMRQI